VVSWRHVSNFNHRRNRRVLTLFVILAVTLSAVVPALTPVARAQGYVCEIVGGAQYLTLGEALAAVADGQTIRLLATIDHSQGISITDGRHIVFDLAGFNLNVASSGGDGLTVTSGSVSYTGAGAFNVSGASLGVNVNGSSASATVTNATATFTGSYGAACSNGGNITIINNVAGGFVGAHAFGANSTIIIMGHATGADANSYGAYAQGGTIIMAGNAQGALCGVSANGPSASATVANATATAGGGNGAVAVNGGDVVVNGNAQGGYNGVSAADPGSTAIINGSATGTASDSSGAWAGFGAVITINGGTAQGVMYGAYANGSDSRITINGGDAIGTGPSSHGVHAEAGGAIGVTGNVQGTQYGVVSGIDCSVIVTGNVSVTADVNGLGVEAERGGTAVIGGNVVASGSSLGASATSHAEITIDGAVLASNYIRIFDDINEVPVYLDGSPGSRTTPTTKAGYYTYSAGTSSVWVIATSADTTPPVWASGYPYINYVLDDELGVVVSANENCTAYYVVLADGADAPSAEQVQNRQDSEGSTAPGGSFLYGNPPNAVGHYVGGLTPQTAYDIYVVLKDSEGNLQTEPARLDVTTLPYIDTEPNDSNSGITGQVPGPAGSRQVTLTVTVRNAAGEAISGIEPGWFEASIDGDSFLQLDRTPPFSGFTNNGDGTYTVVFTGQADGTAYSFTALTVFDVVIDQDTTVRTPPAPDGAPAPAPAPSGTITVSVVKTGGGSVSALPVNVSGAANSTLHTNVSGQAVLTGLWAGTYDVSASAQGYTSDGPKSITLTNDAGSGSATITLTPVPAAPSEPPVEAPIEEPAEEPAGQPEQPEATPETPASPPDLPKTGAAYLGIVTLGLGALAAGWVVRRRRS